MPILSEFDITSFSNIPARIAVINGYQLTIRTALVADMYFIALRAKIMQAASKKEDVSPNTAFPLKSNKLTLYL